MTLPPSPLSTAALSRLRITHRSFITRRGVGRHVPRTAIAVEYRPELQRRLAEDRYERAINAEVLHGDEQKFWSERRTFYTQRRTYFPMWDRCAQALVLMTREVPRVPQEMAFRLMAVFLKLLLLPRLVVNTELMLPSWVSANVEGVVRDALESGDECVGASCEEDSDKKLPPSVAAGRANEKSQ
ncbi:hypothetical protein ERJ75_001465800 [Trypanosoma vivax]|uniref:Uncharacterized protein n=1 Tax=Trypanosoma vivax (strain Y486) TaxID=1055687 RepID=G0TVP8_TRYVY|nr:hypothetical protein TRVL_06379 [Trypanosoma vivax]KAH8607245.1 hypothetical protein ERJ75_001465800 [Trypanosoma vivax]CCC48014.1 conserved hypothetical protein [Trypanosoma vivax Y486]